MEISSSRPVLVEEHSAFPASSSNVRSGAALACRFQVCRIGMSEPRRYDMRIVPPGARPYIRRPAGRGRRSPKAKELPMVEVIERETVNAAIEATVNYILDNGEKIFTQTAAPGSTDVRSGGTVDPHRVTIRNARLHAEPFALDREGFRFVRHDTKVHNFFDEDEIRRVYYPEMEALVKAESGASRVVVFDHTLRTADAEEREARKIREVVRRAHNDYTEWSGPQRVRDLLPADAGDLRCAQRRVYGLRDFRTPLSGPDRADLCGKIQSQSSMVLLPAHAARGG